MSKSSIELTNPDVKLLGELGLGEDQPKSATKPLQVPTLIDVDVFE